jgi:hypothetical protein
VDHEKTAEAVDTKRMQKGNLYIRAGIDGLLDRETSRTAVVEVFAA